MTEEITYYRIEQLFTTGWDLALPEAVHLTKEEGSMIINDLIAEGVNPNHLRAVINVSK